MKHPGVAYVIAALFAFILVVSLSSCSTDGGHDPEVDCRNSGGKVVKVGYQGTCLVDGVVVGEWSR